MTTTTLLMGPAALVAVLLVRGLFRRRGTVLAGSAVVLAALSAAFMAVLAHAGGPQTVELAAWRQARGSGKSAVGALWLEEHLTLAKSLFGGRFQQEAGLANSPAAMVWPVTGSEPAYWALRNVQLVLRDAAHDGGMVLRGSLPARSRLFLESRRALAGPLVPAFPQTGPERIVLAQALNIASDSGHWLQAGRVYPLDLDQAQGVLLDQWAATQPATVAQSLSIWDDLGSQGGHRYFLFARDGIPHLIDFGQP